MLSNQITDELHLVAQPVGSAMQFCNLHLRRKIHEKIKHKAMVSYRHRDADCGILCTRCISPARICRFRPGDKRRRRSYLACRLHQLLPRCNHWAKHRGLPTSRHHPLSFHGGTHYCVDDWHVVRITFINPVDNVIFFTKDQAIADLEATTTTLTLDGVTLPLTQTPIRMLNAADQ